MKDPRRKREGKQNRSIVSNEFLSVVLPAYNEEENIEAAVEEASSVAAAVAGSWEVIVANDGSTDSTAECVITIMAANPHVRLVSFPVNRGYGAALRAGFAAARGSLIFYTDSDRQFDLSELRFFLPLMQQSDLAMGFRVYRYDAVLRCLLSWIYNRLVSLLFRVKVRDVDCSFKLFRRELLETIDIESPDFFVDTELVAKARKWNFRIVERGVRHYPRTAGASTVHASHIPRTLMTVARMWIRLYLPWFTRRDVSNQPVCQPIGVGLAAAKWRLSAKSALESPQPANRQI